MPRPPRVQLIRKDQPSKVISAQYNPNELTETFGAEWSRLKVLGYSGSVKQFAASKDGQLKFTLQFAAKNFGRDGVKQLKEHRRLLKSWCKPRRDVSTVDTAGAPRVIFVWPNFLTMITVIDTVTWKSTLFNLAMEPIEATAEVLLEEILDVLVTADDEEQEGELWRRARDLVTRSVTESPTIKADSTSRIANRFATLCSTITVCTCAAMATRCKGSPRRTLRRYQTRRCFGGSSQIFRKARSSIRR